MSRFQRNGLKAKVFTMAAGLADLWLWLTNNMTPPPFRVMQISSAFWQSRALAVAARLDVATRLGDDEMPVADLARLVNANADALNRLMRMLRGQGLFEQSKSGAWRNNRLSRPLRSDVKHSIRALVLMHNSREMSLPWFEGLERGITSGAVPFELVHGQGFYDYLSQNRASSSLFAEAMDQLEALVGDSFATEFDWRCFDRVIDLGGSMGAKSLAILKRHPHLRALVVDQQDVVANASAYWTARGETETLSRMEFRAGDILQSVPATEDGRDVYLLSAVLHSFSDEACLQTLRHAREAMRHDGARVIVMEMVMPASGKDAAVSAFDMQMFMATNGRERTKGEWARLFTAAGFELEEVVLLVSFGKMLVLRRCG